MEKVGFTIERQEKKSSELSPLWIGSDPKEGLWNLYTAGWGSSGLNRDEKSIFQEMYLPSSAQGIPLFLDNVPDPAFLQTGDDLANGKFNTLEERRDLMLKALPLSVQDSLQTWIVDLQTYAPCNCKLQVSADVGAGVETTFMGPYNLRIAGEEGGVGPPRLHGRRGVPRQYGKGGVFRNQPQVEAMSERELEILRLMAEGLSNRDIAERLVITVGTAKSHVHHILEKLETGSRTQAVAKARELGLV